MIARRKRLLIGVFVVMVLFGLAKFSHAQFNSSVAGTVTDPTGAVVPNAQVTLHSLQTGIELKNSTNSSGIYRFNGIGPGSYQVTVEAAGFAGKVIKDRKSTRLNSSHL